MTTTESPSAHRFDWALALFLSLLALGLFLFRLEHPAEPYFDETLHVFAANDWLQGRVMSDFAHPPLSRLLMALALWCGPGGFDVAQQAWTSNHIWWWRLPSAIAGACTVGVVYAIGRSLQLSRPLAALAAILLMLDGVFFIHARIGMTNAFSILFIALAAGATWRAIRDDQPFWLLGSGLALGAAISTRWTGVFALVGLVVAVLALRRPWATSSPQQVDRWLLCGVLGFAVLPSACYITAFLPLHYHFGVAAARPPRLGDDFWQVFLALNRYLLSFHEYGITHHPGHSAWWTWPSMLNPLWYYIWLDTKAMQVQCVLTVGSPLLWFLSAPIWLYGAFRGIKYRNIALAFCAWMGVCLWLSWAVTARSTTFMTYFGESLPFVALSVAGSLETARASYKMWLMPACTTLAAAWFVWTYPLLSAAPMRVDDYEARLLYPQWDMIRQATRFREQHGLESPARFDAYIEKLGNQTWRYQPGQLVPKSTGNTPSPPKK